MLLLHALILFGAILPAFSEADPDFSHILARYNEARARAAASRAKLRNNSGRTINHLRSPYADRLKRHHPDPDHFQEGLILGEPISVEENDSPFSREATEGDNKDPVLLHYCPASDEDDSDEAVGAALPNSRQNSLQKALQDLTHARDALRHAAEETMRSGESQLPAHENSIHSHLLQDDVNLHQNRRPKVIMPPQLFDNRAPPHLLQELDDQMKVLENAQNAANKRLFGASLRSPGHPNILPGLNNFGHNALHPFGVLRQPIKVNPEQSSQNLPKNNLQLESLKDKDNEKQVVLSDIGSGFSTPGFSTFQPPQVVTTQTTSPFPNSAATPFGVLRNSPDEFPPREPRPLDLEEVRESETENWRNADAGPAFNVNPHMHSLPIPNRHVPSNRGFGHQNFPGALTNAQFGPKGFFREADAKTDPDAHHHHHVHSHSHFSEHGHGTIPFSPHAQIAVPGVHVNVNQAQAVTTSGHHQEPFHQPQFHQQPFHQQQFPAHSPGFGGTSISQFNSRGSVEEDGQRLRQSTFDPFNEKDDVMDFLNRHQFRETSPFPASLSFMENSMRDANPTHKLLKKLHKKPNYQNSYNYGGYKEAEEQQENPQEGDVLGEPAPTLITLKKLLKKQKPPQVVLPIYPMESKMYVPFENGGYDDYYRAAAVEKNLDEVDEKEEATSGSAEEAKDEEFQDRAAKPTIKLIKKLKKKNDYAQPSVVSYQVYPAQSQIYRPPHNIYQSYPIPQPYYPRYREGGEEGFQFHWPRFSDMKLKNEDGLEEHQNNEENSEMREASPTHKLKKLLEKKKNPPRYQYPSYPTSYQSYPAQYNTYGPQYHRSAEENHSIDEEAEKSQDLFSIEMRDANIPPPVKSSDGLEEQEESQMREASPTLKLLKLIEKKKNPPRYQYPAYQSYPAQSNAYQTYQSNAYGPQYHRSAEENLQDNEENLQGSITNEKPENFREAMNQNFFREDMRDADAPNLKLQDNLQNFREAMDQNFFPDDMKQDNFESVGVPYLFDVPNVRRDTELGFDRYKRSADNLDLMFKEERKIVDSLKKRADNDDDDLKFISNVGERMLTNVLDQSKGRNKRHIPLMRLISDPNVKLDVPKTVENFGAAAKNAFEDENAPMYHFKHLVGSSKNALLSALRIPPQHMIIPTDYEIVKADDKLGAINPSIRSGLNKFNSQNTENFDDEYEQDQEYFQTFKRVGAMVRDSIKSGQDTAAHISDAAHDARKILHTARHSAPRLIVPYSQIPALQSTRKIPHKAVLITPKIIDLAQERLQKKHSNREDFVRLGSIMDAVGLSRPDSPQLDLQKFIFESRRGHRPAKVDERLVQLHGKARQNFDDQLETVGEAVSNLEDAKVSVGAKNLRDFLVKMKNELTSVVTGQPSSNEIHKHKKCKNRKKTKEAKEEEKFIEKLFDGRQEKPKDVQEESVGAGLNLPPELLHPFMGRASGIQLRNFHEENGDEESEEKFKNHVTPANTVVGLSLDNQTLGDFLDYLKTRDNNNNNNNKVEPHLENHYDNLNDLGHHGDDQNNSNLGYVLGAINPLMFERMYNQTLKLKNNATEQNPQAIFRRNYSGTQMEPDENSPENGKVGTIMTLSEPMLTPFMGHASPESIEDLFNTYNGEINGAVEDVS